MTKNVTGVTGYVMGYVTSKTPVFIGLLRALRALCGRVHVTNKNINLTLVCNSHVQPRNPVTPVTPVTHAYFMRLTGVMGSRVPRNTPITF